MNIKKFTAFILSAVFVFSSAAFAENKQYVQPESTETTDKITPESNPECFSDALGVDIIMENVMLPIADTAVFELYDSNGRLLGTNTREINANTKSIYLYFTHPQYRLASDFNLKLVSGMAGFTYYSDRYWVGQTVKLHTYVYQKEDGEFFQGNNFIFTGYPLHEKAICIYYNEKPLKSTVRPRIIDGTAMVCAEEMAAAMMAKYSYSEEYNSVSIKSGENEILFNVDNKYTTVFGNDTYISHAPVWVDGKVFVPVRDLCEAFGSTLEVLDFGDHLDVLVSDSPIIREYLNKSIVNRNGISSRTNYLVWISKSEFTVRVYTGSQYNWNLEYAAPCGIGAWGTPTIEGQFEYQYRVSSWTYPSYYVGPCLVFYGGYAMHSTLLNYDGTEYDGTVGAHISHGCVRLHPQDINWIADHIPVGTKIYITG